MRDLPLPTARLQRALVGSVAALLALSFFVSAYAQPPADQADAADDAPPALGDRENPVRCDGPRGERYYLARLVDPDGAEIRFHRVGSFGGPHGSILDGYEVTIGERTIMVFMDMYHPGFHEDEPVDGLDIRCRLAWGLLIREGGKRYAPGEDTPYHGEYNRVNDDGTTIATLVLDDGLIQGPVLRYDDAGVLRSEVEYADGVEHGLGRYFDEEGRHRAQIAYEHGQRHGPAQWIYPDGQVETDGAYDRGAPAGEWRDYFPDGVLMRVGSFVDGRRHGEWITYSRDGEVEKTEHFEAGERVEPDVAGDAAR